MVDYTGSTFRDLFRDRLSNNPAGWAIVADYLDAGSNLLKSKLLEGVEASVRTAEQVSANLFCSYVAAKQENIEIGFQQMVNEAPGRSFGSRLVNWIIAKTDTDISKNLKVTWSSFQQQMSSAIEMMIKDLLDAPGAQGLVTSPEQVLIWIDGRGGMGQLHMDFMNRRRVESQQEKVRKESDRQAGAELRRQREAEEAGFDSVTAYQSHQAATALQAQEQKRRNKFDVLRQRMLSAGRVVNGRVVLAGGLKVGSLLIVSSEEGALCALSDADEYALLSCGAAALV